jgi:hypothetical protein
MTGARKAMAGSSCTAAAGQQQIGLLDVRLVHFLFDKQETDKGVFKSMEDIGAAFCGAAHVVDSPWVAGAGPAGEVEARESGAEASASSTANNKSAFVTFSADGALADPFSSLRDAGFKVGGLAKHRKKLDEDKNPLIGTIVSMDKFKVTVTYRADDATEEVGIAEFKRDFAMHRETISEELTNWATYDPATNVTMVAAATKGAAIAAMHALYVKHRVNFESMIMLHDKPKCVRC